MPTFREEDARRITALEEGQKTLVQQIKENDTDITTLRSELSAAAKIVDGLARTVENILAILKWLAGILTTVLGGSILTYIVLHYIK